MIKRNLERHNLRRMRKKRSKASVLLYIYINLWIRKFLDPNTRDHIPKRSEPKTQ